MTISRRYFFAAAGAGALARTVRAAPKRTVVLMLIDGFGIDYFARSDMPNLKRLAAEGGFHAASSMIPSVTNINNASVVTGRFPSEHGITANYFRDPGTKEWKEMDSSSLLLCPTIFETWKTRGRKTAIVSAKRKVLSLCGRDAGIQMCAETPSDAAIAIAGAKADMYSPESNYWTMSAAIEVLRKENPDLLYISTTDYMMHTYPPGDERSLAHLHKLDALIADLVNAAPNVELYITADHGMSPMHEAIDVDRILARQSIKSQQAPIVRDKHQVHHQNLGGAVYLFLDDQELAPRAIEILRQTPGIDEVYASRDAAQIFQLHPERIADVMVLASKGCALGILEAERQETKVRTHGSRHESVVPVFAWGRKVNLENYAANLDITRNLES